MRNEPTTHPAPAGTWRTGATSIAGFRQFYREWRPGEERYPPVLALHGSLTQSGMWIALAERIGDLRMVCPDQRGYGRSDTPQGDACADFARDARLIAESLLPARYVVVGHSFACSIALELARVDAERVAGVVLIDPVVRLPGAQAPRNPAVPRPESFATLAEAERHFLETEEGEWNPAALARFTRDVMIEAGGAWRFPYTAERLGRLRSFTASAGGDYDLLGKAALVTTPVLACRGGASKRFPASAEAAFLAAFSPRPLLVPCPKSGHFPTATEPGIVAEALLEFVARAR
ncbi:MAG: alpha/beta hydrolase [Burkholderiales bacterium]|nr:alpha/beta hydrolase [Burkholderiales bacterium]